MDDETITVNGVPVDEYLTGVKEKKITEETTADFHKTLHRSSQDKSTLHRSRHTVKRAGQSIQKADIRNMKTSEKRSRVTHYNQWDMVINGEENMAHAAIITILQDSSRWNLFDIDKLMFALKETTDLPPKIDQLKYIIRQFILDGTITPYAFLQGNFVPYKEGSKKKIYFILSANDDEREDFLDMNDIELNENLVAFSRYCEELFGPFMAEYVAMVKKEPMKVASKAGDIYNHTMARKLCQLGEPVALNDLLASFQSNGYPMKDNGTIRAILKRFKEKDLINLYIKKAGEWVEVSERPQGEKIFYALKSFDELPLRPYMKTKPETVDVPKIEPVEEQEEQEEEVTVGLPQAVNSYDDIIDQMFPPQKPETIEQVKGPGLRGLVSSHVAGREIFDIIRSAGKVISAGAVQQELRNRGYTKTGSTAIRRAMTLLVQADLVNLYTKNKGKTTKVDSIIPGKSMSAKFMKPLDQPALSQPENEALLDMESSDNGLDDEALPVVVQEEQKEVIAEAAPILERAAQAEPAAIDMDSFVTMLKQQGVKRFEIEF